MKKRIVSCVIAGVIALSMCPNISASASQKRELKAGEVVTVNRTEEEFTFTVKEEGIYTLFTNLPQNQVKMSVYNEAYNLITSLNGISTTTLRPGKYFVKIENTWGMQLNGEFGVLPSLNYNDIEKIDTTSSNIMFRLRNNNIPQESKLIVETCENKDVNEDTIITVYDKNLNVVGNSDDLSQECKYSRYLLNPKSQSDFKNGENIFVKIESKDKAPLSTTVAFTEDNTRSTGYVGMISPDNGGYYLLGEEIQVKAYGNSAVSEIGMEYRGIDTSDNENIIALNKMVKDAKSNTYKGTVKPQREHHLSAYKNGGDYISPKIVGVAKSFKNDITESKIDAYFTYYDRTSYKAMDTSWYYNSPFNHSFKGYGTNQYNCMAYGLGVTDQWMWPWSPAATGIPFEVVSYYFGKKYGHANRPGYKFTEFSETVMPYTEVIYYEGHVAVVTEWDKNGMPTKLISKWGGLELIESSYEGLIRWGEPLVFMKGRE
ncbi:MAG: DUF7689 domain-containing protein [Clostridium sp.]